MERGGGGGGGGKGEISLPEKVKTGGEGEIENWAKRRIGSRLQRSSRERSGMFIMKLVIDLVLFTSLRLSNLLL